MGRAFYCSADREVGTRYISRIRTLVRASEASRTLAILIRESGVPPENPTLAASQNNRVAREYPVIGGSREEPPTVCARSMARIDYGACVLSSATRGGGFLKETDSVLTSQNRNCPCGNTLGTSKHTYLYTVIALWSGRERGSVLSCSYRRSQRYTTRRV